MIKHKPETEDSESDEESRLEKIFGSKELERLSEGYNRIIKYCERDEKPSAQDIHSVLEDLYKKVDLGRVKSWLAQFDGSISFSDFLQCCSESLESVKNQESTLGLGASRLGDDLRQWRQTVSISRFTEALEVRQQLWFLSFLF